MEWDRFDSLIEAALREDGALEDVTTAALVSPDAGARARIVVKAPGVLCGLPIARRTAQLLDPDLAMTACCEDGAAAEEGTAAAELSGPAGSMLRVERTLLNFLQRLSGIATLTERYVRQVEGTGARIFDTRKTTPGWRLLEKYAVRCGGGCNHRMGLSDQVLIKDNHLRLRGSGGKRLSGAVEEAVRTARRKAGGLAVEVEVTDLLELREALRGGADIILLDNMTPGQVREAAGVTERECKGGRRPELEASGGITLANVRAYADAGVDRISIGALTHSAPALDISMDFI